MNIEEFRHIAIRLPELRKKELTQRLSYSEQAEMEQLLKKRTAEIPRYGDRQLRADVILIALGNYTFEDVTSKQTFIQKLVKTHPEKEYRLRPDTLQDADEEGWPFAMFLKLRDIMAEAGLADEWPKMLPVAEDVLHFDPMEEEDKQWFESFPDPAWCLAKLDECKGFWEAAAAHGPEMESLLQWMEGYWRKGYQVYADIKELFDIYGDEDE